MVTLGSGADVVGVVSVDGSLAGVTFRIGSVEPAPVASVLGAVEDGSVVVARALESVVDASAVVVDCACSVSGEATATRP